ncbi:hypothetical protein [Oligoflexus tunisiensis]|uniref:hypothetical protein n=1 Tax=Oligoflexus tunisiensis TaxID=708132 RepID=UPI000AB27AD2|nr:hypothetical protein [Oligoflexus tunisiensis]
MFATALPTLRVWILILLSCTFGCSGDSGGTSAVPATSATDVNDPTNPDNPDDPDEADPEIDDPETPDDPADPANIIMGQVGTLALDPNAAMEVSAYVLNSDGTKGATVGTATVDVNGNFQLQIDPNIQSVEFAVQTTGSGLRLNAGTPIARSRVTSLSKDKVVAINPVTEMAAERMDKLVAEGQTFAVARVQATAETRAATGISNTEVAPGKIAEITDAASDAARYGLYLQGLKGYATALGGEDSEFIMAWKKDFSDGSMDGKLSTTALSVGSEKLLHERSYDNILRDNMKEYVKAQSSTTVSFNSIPDLDANPAATINMLSDSEKSTYSPPTPTYYDHWVEIRPGSGMSTEFDSLTDCLGPFTLVRTNAYGQTITTGPSLPVQLSESSNGTNGTYHSAADCSDSAITSVTINSGSSATADLYFKPGNYTPQSLMIYVSSSDVEKVEGDFLYLDALLNGTPIANILNVAVIDSTAAYPASHEYIGDADSMLTRDTCYPVVAELTRGGTPGAVFPGTVTLSSFNNSAVGAPSDATAAGFYSDDSCSANLVTLQITQGNTHNFFYVKMPAGYTRSPYFPPNGMMISYVLIPTTVTAGTAFWVYGAD